MAKNAEKTISKEELKKQFIEILHNDFQTTPDEADDKKVYEALSKIVVGILKKKRRKFTVNTQSAGKKKVYYLSMEFLMGRSLKTSLYNLEMNVQAKEMLKDLGISINGIYEQEPDAGLGNGGLGRLAACYLDALAADGYHATGYSICYEYGIFKQKLEDGWQTELPDNWLPGGSVWLVPVPTKAIEVRFDGELKEYWDNQYHCVTHENYTSVMAVPYDLFVSGYGSEAVSKLRLWKAEMASFDMPFFNKGDYAKALSKNIMSQAITKVLYPNDNHAEGKSLRLRQQYFLCAASIGDIVNQHMSVYGTLDNLHEKVAIHINDTHPTLAIPELMRILLDDCGYSWDKSWHIVTNTFAYTNHIVMPEALEKWDCNLLKSVCPRIFSIIIEINERYCRDLWERYKDEGKVSHMSIVENNKVKMATLCVHASHSVNGVAKIHSEIIKRETFKDEYLDTPTKFKNVTNGIAYRRWLYQSNEGLTELLREKIGDGFLKNAAELSKLAVFKNDEEVLNRLADIKAENKQKFAKYVKNQYGTVLNTESIFDVQVKRLHEYKRQQLNALNIIAQYNYLKNNPDAPFVPKTYIFAAKAAPGYYMAKQIIKLIWNISEELKKNDKLREKLNVIFLEDYNVSLSEILMPAADISEQISLAGTEASGTGNMKLMINGAVTLGTMDGANVEIHEQVGDDNIIIFGMNVDEVNACKASYRPIDIYNSNPVVKQAIDTIQYGVNGVQFPEIADTLKNTDTYMALKDFDSYQKAQKYASECYSDKLKWQRMSLANIAGAGIFSADRAVEEYAKDIWGLTK
ncbi:glycogen/starch/alpha-glucan phosphorylase [Ruminococcus albus]|uniref:Alpha-1,4 glucan phosphorylase n=1 Tax=Ruminococcus albus 8 TaxID=246199 RepID=E9SGM9_RUMAL|nr:glycogen/starch/alpha-glucan phosphorylase [Ruminococcus albus]EGC01563.1 phosphorylase, glycogen/starch/alpha-glucan family [Ruminococcus albus 8]MCC3350314.1 glycogen/starch/alpha-glucan phosphorylase [Ruminococcus albus 8]